MVLRIKNWFLCLLGIFSAAVSCRETVSSNTDKNTDTAVELQILYDRFSLLELRELVSVEDFLYDMCLILDADGKPIKTERVAPIPHNAIVTTDSAAVAPFLYSLRNAHKEIVGPWDYVDTRFVAILKNADHSDTLAFDQWPRWRIRQGDSTFIDRDLCLHLYRTVFARDTAWLDDIKSSWLYRYRF